MTASTMEIPVVSASTRLPLVTWVLTAGTFLMCTSEFIIAGLLPDVAADFSVTVSQAGLAITVFAIGMIVGAPSMALLTLRMQRRHALAAAVAIFAVGHVIAATTPDFTVLMIARFITAISTGAFWAVAAVVAADAAGPAASSRALGVVLGGAMLANVIGVPLGSFVGQSIGWRGPFWLLAIVAVPAALAIIRLVPATPPSPNPVTLRAELRSLRSARLWLVLLTCALVTGGVLSVYSYIAPLLTARTGLPASAVPIALVVFGVTGLVGSIVAGRLGDRRPYAVAFVVFAVSLLATIALAASSTQPVPTFLLFALLGLSGLSANPILVNLAVRLGGDAPTLASGLTPSMFNVGTAIGTGITAAALGSPLGELAPTTVGIVAGTLVFLPFTAVAVLARRAAER
jgi:predicted MFS family arabinose efflux permease